MDINTEETFIRTAPPLNRVEVKLGGDPSPWEILTADDARELACEISAFVEAEALSKLWLADARVLDAYADAVDALTSRLGATPAKQECFA